MGVMQKSTKIPGTVKGLKLDCWRLKGKRAMVPCADHQQGECPGGKEECYDKESSNPGSAEAYDQGSASEAQALSRGVWDQR